MQVTIENISQVEKKVAVELPWPYVARKLDDKYREIGRAVALKGFRKGKVPRPILEQMYAQSVEREIVQELVQESFIAAANQYSLQPVSEPVAWPRWLRWQAKTHAPRTIWRCATSGVTASAATATRCKPI